MAVQNLKELEQPGSPCHPHQVEMHLQTGTDIEEKWKGDCALYGDKNIYTSIIMGRTAPLSRLHISFIAVMQIWMSLSFLGLERAAFDQLPGWVFYAPPDPLLLPFMLDSNLAELFTQHRILLSAIGFFLSMTGFVIVLTTAYARLSTQDTVMSRHAIAFTLGTCLGLFIGATPLELVLIFAPIALTVAMFFTCAIPIFMKQPILLRDNIIKYEVAWEA